MNDMHTIPTQKTYKKQSANQILADCEVSEMSAGGYEITNPKWRGCIFQRTDSGDLIISNVSGAIVILECGERATKKLDRLYAVANKKNLEIYG